MTDPAFYREEAERCGRMAGLSPGKAAAKRWCALADEYLQLALASDAPARNAERPGQAGSARAAPADPTLVRPPPIGIASGFPSNQLGGRRVVRAKPPM